MGIKSTLDINRETIIERIKFINYLLKIKNYREIENNTSEYDYELKAFVDNNLPVEEDNLGNFTNAMLEEIIDRPFYRWSMFDNYCVIDLDEENLS